MYIWEHYSYGTWGGEGEGQAGDQTWGECANSSKDRKCDRARDPLL